MFTGWTVLPDSMETELGSSDQEASLSTGKNSGIILVPCYAWKCVSTAISGGADISEWGPCVSFVVTDEFSVRVTKITSKSGVSELAAYLSVFNVFLTQWIMTTFSAFKIGFDSRQMLRLWLRHMYVV